MHMLTNEFTVGFWLVVRESLILRVSNEIWNTQMVILCHFYEYNNVCHGYLASQLYKNLNLISLVILSSIQTNSVKPMTLLMQVKAQKVRTWFQFGIVCGPNIVNTISSNGVAVSLQSGRSMSLTRFTSTIIDLPK